MSRDGWDGSGPCDLRDSYWTGSWARPGLVWLAETDSVRMRSARCSSNRRSGSRSWSPNSSWICRSRYLTVWGWTWIAWVWAFAICYAQIYVGIHYPLDIVGGALLGTLFGLFLAMFFNKKFGFANFDTQPTGTL